MKKGIKKITDKFKSLSKKQKTILIVILVLILVFTTVLVLYFIYKEDNKKPKKEKEEVITVEVDNYLYENGNLIFLNAKGEKLGKYKCENEDVNICEVAYYTGETDVNVVDYVYKNTEEVKIRSAVYNERYVFVKDSKEEDEILFYDIEEEEIIEKFSELKKGEDLSVILKNEDEMYGLIEFNLDGYVNSIQFEYEDLMKIPANDNFIFKTSSGYGIITDTNKVLVKNIPNLIYDYTKNYIAVKANNDYYLYDYSEEKVYETSFDYIATYEEFLIFIKDKLLFIRDNDLDKINEDGIRLKDTSYKTKYIFDEKTNKKLEEIRAYEITKVNDKLSISVSNTDYDFNLFEQALNKKYGFVRYINKKLYFYSDEEKEELVGDYSCENENIVTNSTKEFSNCFIAKEDEIFSKNLLEEIPLAPVINDKYAFINDQKNLAVNQKIVLRDLEVNKTLANYIKVDVGLSGESKITLASEDDIFVAGINQNKDLGVIKIDSNKVVGVVPFKQVEVSRMADHFLTKDKTSKYNIYSFDGKKLLETETKNEIVSFDNKRILTKTTDNKYNLYNTGGKIIKANLNYILLKEKFFLTVEEADVIKIYGFEDPSTNLIDPSEIIEAKKPYSETLDFEETQKGFKISVAGITYSVSGVDNNE